MISLLNHLLNDQQYYEDIDLINNTIDEIVNLLSDDNYINNETLILIEDNINYLDVKYDDLYELINLYDPIKTSYKQLIHDKYVERIRKENREKKEGN
ncbi:MAG: hypothetical protein PHO63_05290 [Bacilli bacterium]|nr:hypothetical protein [Bacilli bacterium]MDD4808508.1 hypothetical protein [Bacilli bacterium]